MRRASSIGSVATVAAGVAMGLVAWLTARPASAIETRADVETDHVSAADDGGPRRVGVLVSPFPMGIGWLGGEVDAALGERVLVTFEGDAHAFGASGYAAAAGLALFTQGLVFRGLYGRFTAEWAHEAAFAVSATAIGGSIRFGYEWTALSGPTLRLGGGFGYAFRTVSASGYAVDIGGVQPRLDANVGWVF